MNSCSNLLSVKPPEFLAHCCADCYKFAKIGLITLFLIGSTELYVFPNLFAILWTAAHTCFCSVLVYFLQISETPTSHVLFWKWPTLIPLFVYNVCLNPCFEDESIKTKIPCDKTMRTSLERTQDREFVSSVHQSSWNDHQHQSSQVADGVSHSVFYRHTMDIWEAAVEQWEREEGGGPVAADQPALVIRDHSSISQYNATSPTY